MCKMIACCVAIVTMTVDHSHIRTDVYVLVYVVIVYACSSVCIF